MEEFTYDIWYVGCNEPQRLTEWNSDYESLKPARLDIIAHTEKEIGAQVDDPENYVILPN